MKNQPKTDVYIDINSVAFLKSYSFYSGHLYVGANTTLTDAIELFKKLAVENYSYFRYTHELALHLEKVANTSVRNVSKKYQVNVVIIYKNYNYPETFFTGFYGNRKV